MSLKMTFYSNSACEMPFKDLPWMYHIKNPVGSPPKPHKNLLILMAGQASKCLLFFLLLFAPAICASATLAGFSYDGRSGETLSATKTVSFLKLNKISPSQIRVYVTDDKVLNTLFNTGVSVDFYLNETRIENPGNFMPSSLPWFKTHLLTFLPHVNIKSVVASSIRSELPGENKLIRVLSTLKSTHSILSSFRLSSEVKASVAFSLEFLEKLDGKHDRDLDRIFRFIKKTGSFVIVEASVDGELSMGDRFVQAVIKRAIHANAVLPSSEVPMVLTIKSPAVPSGIEVAAFTDKISKSLENNTEAVTNIMGIYAEVSEMEEFNQQEMRREEEQLFPTSRREMLKATSHDVFDPPTTFPTNPVTIPLDNPTPTIVTVPSSSPITITPANPDATGPVTIPSTTPITIPPANPMNSPPPVPDTTPTTVPGAQPITNPVTTYPAPSGNIPATTPFTSPVMPPTTPAGGGQSWCVAKTGATESALQDALDYACGIGGADCSMIQQGASCYNPNTLQSHASYAFNSYYQKNPVASSCDFGGTAGIVNINPSTGSCVFPSSSSSSSSLSPAQPTTSSPTTAAPTTTAPTTITPTTTSTWPTISGSGTPPSFVNTSNPASATTTSYGSGSPQGASSSVSGSAPLLRSFVGGMILMTSFVTTKIILDI